jgi:signal transduction histidine kinase
VIELVQVHAGELKVELRWQPAAEMPDLVFDPEGLHRAVLNVVSNAIDAAGEIEPPAGEIEPPGWVAVRTEYAADAALLRIVVEDNGPGIPAEQVDKLFSPFASTKKGRGTGLGLPVSQKILNEHGGRILVNSQPGGGSRFTLELPAVLPHASAQTTAH